MSYKEEVTNFLNEGDNFSNLCLELKEYLIFNKKNFNRIALIYGKKTELAMEYISFVAYPLEKEEEQRLKFVNALKTVYFREYVKPELKPFNKYSMKLLEEVRGYTRAPRNIEKTIAQGEKRFTKRLVAWHAYDLYKNRYQDGLKVTFYEVLLETASAYACFDSRFSKVAELYEDIKRDKGIEENKSDTYKENRQIINDWKSAKPILHLAYGYYENFLRETPEGYKNIKNAILNPSWVNDAVKYSQLYLAGEIFNHNNKDVFYQADYKVQFDVEEYLFVDFYDCPIEIRKDTFL